MAFIFPQNLLYFCIKTTNFIVTINRYDAGWIVS